MIETILGFIASYWWIAILAGLVAGSKFIFGWVIIGEQENGIVERKWGGKDLPEGRIIATKKESGVWAEMLPPGLKFWYWPWMYTIRRQPITVIRQGYIGYVEAIDGAPMPQGNIISRKHVECDSYTNGKAFIEGGGIKGYQPGILANGEYRINEELFKVIETPVEDIPADKIGVVTTREGKPLPHGDIAGAPIDADHNDFQDVHAFLTNGGFKGVQEEVLRPGVYHIHPKFATVEQRDMTRVDVGYVGVVNSFIGKDGGDAADTSGEDFKHGNIVPKGHKGIWSETLDPGFHPINTKLMEVLMVPTTNIVLKWADDNSGGSHQYDESLKTINIRSIDGFNFNMQVDQVINISHHNAPKVIARFGTVQNMIDQVLEPTVGNYFRNAAQTSEALKFVFERTERQADARKHIDERLKKYNIVCVDTLIGDIDPPKKLMDILADQKEADQQKEMWVKKKESAEQEQIFVKAQTAAKMEEALTTAEYDKQIATKNAGASIEKAKGERESDKIKADGEAYVLKTVGTAKASNIKDVGGAEAKVIELKTEAMGKGEYASVEVAKALAEGGIEIVPKVMVGGDGNGETSMASALMAVETWKQSTKMVDPGRSKQDYDHDENNK